MTGRGSARVTPAHALLATIVVLAVADVARSAWLPGEFHLAYNIGLAAVVAGIAVAAGLSADELGVRNVASGLRWGAAAFAIVSGVVVAAAIVAPSWSVFEDDRVELSAAELARKALVTIPLGTVLLEEFAFRGSLMALLRRRSGVMGAIAGSSLLFGLWHVPGAWKSSGSGTAEVAQSTAGRVGATLLVVLATTVAGCAFAWLRIRAGSIIAPSLAHLATNSVVLAVAWAVAR